MIKKFINPTTNKLNDVNLINYFQKDVLETALKKFIIDFFEKKAFYFNFNFNND